MFNCHVLFCCSPFVSAAKFGGDGQPRGFDHSKYAQRHVVLQLMYVGWSYQGFARQADSDNTIEVGGWVTVDRHGVGARWAVCKCV